MRKLILVTGEPGIGKTSLLQRVYWDYKARGVKIGGVLTREVREGKNRVGFMMMDLESGKEGWLARTDMRSGPKIGKYVVHLAGLESVGTAALESARADDTIQLVLLDEIGPMEMASTQFEESVERLVESQNKPVLATFKLGSKYHSVETALKDESVVLLQMGIDNRETLLKEITRRLDAWLREVEAK